MLIPYFTIGKWIAGILAILAVGWITYAGLIRPTTKPPETTKQEAQTIINHNYTTPKVAFGCMNFRIYDKKNETNPMVAGDNK